MTNREIEALFEKYEGKGLKPSESMTERERQELYTEAQKRAQECNSSTNFEINQDFKISALGILHKMHLYSMKAPDKELNARGMMCRHTLDHKNAMCAISYSLTGGIPKEILEHDVDKLVLDGLDDVALEDVHKYHVKHAPHHDFDNITEENSYEIVLDWESARYTKADKPLNAYMAARYFGCYTPEIKAELQRLGLDSCDYKHIDFKDWQFAQSVYIKNMLESLRNRGTYLYTQKICLGIELALEKYFKKQ